MSLPMRPRVRLNLTPDLLSPPTGYESGGLATFSGGGGGVERRLVEWEILVDWLN